MELSEKTSTPASRYYRYNHSPGGLERMKRYNASEKGILRQQRYRANGNWARVMNRYYHRIQDEAGCHWEIASFYPAYRFIKALETAEIVEIKL